MINEDPKDVLAKVEAGEMASWSESLRNDFCLTFQNRTKVARFLNFYTAIEIWQTAERRHFISVKHMRDVFKGLVHLDDHRRAGMFAFSQYLPLDACYDSDKETRRYNHGVITVGGRDVQTLMSIAKERAQTVLSNLPPLAKAVRIIDAVTAKKIDRVAAIEEQGEKLRGDLDEVCGTIVMSELDPTMTIGVFLKMVSDRDDKRKALLKKINDLAVEGQRLESEIAKTLYAGLPGLTDAVVTVIRQHIEQALGLEGLGRRVEEQVKFGNSDAAVELLRTFEKDEVKITDEVGETFRLALEKLKVVAQKKKPKAKGSSKELRA